MFRQLGEIGFEDVDAMLLERMIEARNRGSDMRAPARPATGKATTKTLREGMPWPSMQRVEGGAIAAMETGEKDRSPKAPARVQEVSKVPTRIAPRVMPQGRADMDMTTAHRRNGSDAPRSAVVISMLAWKRDHASQPTA